MTLRESLTLDLSRPVAEAPLAATVEEPERFQLAQIEIAEVVNPKLLRVAFELHYRGAEGERLLLGEFSLFPPDNPGDFLIATRGRLRSGGALELSMTPLDESGPEDELSVTVRRIGLRRE